MENQENFADGVKDDTSRNCLWIHMMQIQTLNTSLLKKKLGNQKLFPSSMKEIMWRENVTRSQNKDIFSSFCELSARKYYTIEN